jgi:hypothetical protein
MENFKPLSVFFEATSKDACISVAHIGLYAVLLQCWQAQDFQNPIMAFSQEIMQFAKISNRVTYLKYLTDLNDGGYIRYERCLKRNEKSRIYILF